MKTTLELPLPSLAKGCFASLEVLTDESLFQLTGIRIAFTGREGGVSRGSFDSLNLGGHVDDEIEYVAENRRILQQALGTDGLPLVVPKQVHGDHVASLSSNTPDAIEAFSEEAKAGADGVVIGVTDVAACLCFADCVPLIIVSPARNFAIVHAGWRGVENEIVISALEKLSMLDGCTPDENFWAGCNVYIGPYIHAECFEIGPEVHSQFVKKFGEECSWDARHIDLGAALRISLRKSGIVDQRIADSGICSVCHNERFFSFRAQGGICGRHGAYAVRFEDSPC